MKKTWNIENAELWFKKYFFDNPEPQSMHLSQAEYIENVQATVESHLKFCKNVVETNQGYTSYQPYLNRLRLIRQKLEEKSLKLQALNQNKN